VQLSDANHSEILFPWGGWGKHRWAQPALSGCLEGVWESYPAHRFPWLRTSHAGTSHETPPSFVHRPRSREPTACADVVIGSARHLPRESGAAVRSRIASPAPDDGLDRVSVSSEFGHVGLR